ncbi:NAD(P)-dependent alcohol dehydrogenase [Streptomyces sp. YIM 98790]|uniref:NAD(P)-dependent alcohol dehydrogenase n=1 Tax=Streptomyces sp. YIM 98790 TaxID=2689077 RepID=UPI00140B5AA1|nr:NAD(P)-dependent alcohol dehydrogenase [Streptomyces sp. YIM 98790]
MQAVMFDKYGGPEVLGLREVDKPVPGDRSVLIKVHATTVTAAECLLRRGEPKWGRVISGFTRPRRRMRTLGTELSGQVEAVGRKVRRFRPGDEVFGFAGFRIGANAQYMCLPENASLEPKPANRTHEESASAVDGATTALYFLRDKAGIHSGQRVLINGAAGSIGTYAVQLAKHFGAEVTAVCGAGNAGLVTSLGADTVIDYAREDFTRNTGAYDIIFDAVGKSSFRACRGALSDRGCYLSTMGLHNYLWMLLTFLTRGKRVRTGLSVRKNEALLFLKDLLENDRLTLVIDRNYRLDQIVEAHRYVDRGHKRGNVVVTVAH